MPRKSLPAELLRPLYNREALHDLADKFGQFADDNAFQEYRAMAKQMHRWHVVKMKAKGEELCTIEAPDAETAIALTIERYQITDPETRKRLAAVRLG
jgi:hypothetical protein